MSKLIWSSDPAHPRDERRDLAFRAWAAVTRYLKPELFTPANDRLDEVNEIYAEFDNWWKKHIDQCLYVIPDGDGYWSCVLSAGHEGDHQTDSGHEQALGTAWILPDQVAWRQRRKP
jgi:hypothetical protein